MSGFGHYERDAAELEREIFKRGLQLRIDWSDHVAVRALAREALDCDPACNNAALHDADPRRRARAELYALAELMLLTMKQSAEVGVHTHGGPTWKAFGRALMEEYEARRTGAAGDDAGTAR